MYPQPHFDPQKEVKWGQRGPNLIFSISSMLQFFFLFLLQNHDDLNPIPRVVWNYVNPCGGAIMARMDSSHPEAVSRHPKAQK